MAGLGDRILRYLRNHGVSYTARRGLQKAGERFLGTYERIWQRLAPDEEACEHQRKHQPPAGKLSLLIPVYNTNPELLRALLDSITAQTYENWEAVLMNTGDKPEPDRVLSEAAAADPRFRVFRGENLGISGNTNAALAHAEGDWCVLCDHDDTLSPEALWVVADCICREQPDLIYTDEDKITEDGRIHTDAHFKPDFCPDNLRSANYFCHLMAMRTELLRAVGGLRSEFDGSQDHELALRLTETAQRICHLPVVTYHWRTVGSSASHSNLDKCLKAAAKAVEEHCARIGYPCSVSVEDALLRLHYEVPQSLTVTLITDGSWQPDRPGTEVLRIPEWSAEAIGAAAKQASGDFLLLMHCSVAPVGPDFVTELLMYAQRRDVGTVMPVLTDSINHIRHAGFQITEDGRLLRRNAGLNYRAGGWRRLSMESHNVAAVSPLCLMLRRELLPKDYTPTASGAADMCLRQLKEGLVHVYTPHAQAICGDAKLAAQREDSAFRQAHAGFTDPCCSPCASRKRADFSTRKDMKRHAY